MVKEYTIPQAGYKNNPLNHIGYSVNGKAMKWYKCHECGVLWESIYPDFPAQGAVRKLIADDYTERR